MIFFGLFLRGCSTLPPPPKDLVVCACLGNDHFWGAQWGGKKSPAGDRCDDVARGQLQFLGLRFVLRVANHSMMCRFAKATPIQTQNDMLYVLLLSLGKNCHPSPASGEGGRRVSGFHGPDPLWGGSRARGLGMGSGTKCRKNFWEGLQTAQFLGSPCRAEWMGGTLPIYLAYVQRPPCV